MKSSKALPRYGSGHKSAGDKKSLVYLTKWHISVFFCQMTQNSQWFIWPNGISVFFGQMTQNRQLFIWPNDRSVFSLAKWHKTANGLFDQMASVFSLAKWNKTDIVYLTKWQFSVFFSQRTQNSWWFIWPNGISVFFDKWHKTDNCLLDKMTDQCFLWPNDTKQSMVYLTKWHQCFLWPKCIPAIIFQTHSGTLS